MIDLNNRPTEEKTRIPENKHILNCLTLLENIYEQCEGNSEQKRLFRINKAINSIKKYTNFTVSSFNLDPKKPSTEKEPEKCSINVSQNQKPHQQDPKNDNIEDLLQLIEKELKESGISQNDIDNDSLFSTSKKSIDSNSENKENLEKKDISNPNINESILQKKNINKKRLSKLFLKIELKLKTFLQENNIKKEISENKENDIKKDNLMSLEGKLMKTPSKLPDIMDSFFSDKNKVNSILTKVKKQKRKSVIDFARKYGQLSKEEKGDDEEIDYNQDSIGAKSFYRRRQKMPEPNSEQVMMRYNEKKKEQSRNSIITGKVSNFCDMIDEKEEIEDLEGIKNFGDVIREEDPKEKIPNINADNTNETEGDKEKGKDGDSCSFNLFKECSPIKIVSSLNHNNNNKDNLMNSESSISNFSYINRKSILLQDKKDDENTSDYNYKSNQNDQSQPKAEKPKSIVPFIDDELFKKSSNKKELSSNKDSSSENSNSNNSKSKENESINNEQLNMIKFINNSNNRPPSNYKDDTSEKPISNFGKKNTKEKKEEKNELQRDIIRANNINQFYLNSILSPLKDLKLGSSIIDQNRVIEEFSKLNNND